jgi:hypothetical protein
MFRECNSLTADVDEQEDESRSPQGRAANKQGKYNGFSSTVVSMQLVID